MKLRTISLSAISLLLMTILISACQKIGQPALQSHEKRSSLSIKEAKSWFVNHQNNYFTNERLSRGKENKFFHSAFAPLWKNAKRRLLRDERQILEIPIHPESPVSVKIGKPDNAGNRTDSTYKKFHPTKDFTRLVMIKDSSAMIHAALMEIIADTTCLKNHHYTLAANNFLTTGKHFTGVVLFKDFPSGAFMWGYRYVNGVLEGKIHIRDNNTPNGQSRFSMFCEMAITTTTTESVYYEGQWLTATQVHTDYVYYSCGGGADMSSGGGGTGGHTGGGGGLPGGYPKGGNHELTFAPSAESSNRALLQQKLNKNPFGLLPCGTINHFYKIATFQTPASVIKRLKN